MKGRRILISGGAGFVGSNLARHLVEAGAENVIVIDNLTSGREENILPEGNNYKFIRGDIRDARLASIIKSYRIDTIFHQAAVVSVQECTETPEYASMVNIEGTLCVLNCAKEFSIPVVLASSCAVYGNTPDTIISEDNPINPLTMYAVTKLTNEYQAKVMHEINGLRVACLRYFNIYGPHQNPKSQYAAVIPIFLSRAIKGETLYINGDGLQTRDFVHVNDIVAANVLSARALHDENKIDFGIMNIGSGTSINIKDLALMVSNISLNSVDIKYRDVIPGDIKYSSADIRYARKILGYSPNISFNVGLRATYDHFLEQECLE